MIEIPERYVFDNCETPERTPIQKYVILDDRVQSLEMKLSVEKVMLKHSKGIIDKFRIWKRLRKTKEELDRAVWQLHDLHLDGCLRR